MWFIWTIHHALYDGWSMPMMVDMLDRAYHRKLIERTSQFQPFVAYIKQKDDDKMKNYWR